MLRFQLLEEEILQWRRILRARPRLVLCLDGGGMRTLAQLRILRYLEDRLFEGRKLHEYFDMVCGIGIGGIAALGLGQGKSVRQMEELLWELPEAIFQQGYESWWGGYQFDKQRGIELITKYFTPQSTAESKSSEIAVPTDDGGKGDAQQEKETGEKEKEDTTDKEKGKEIEPTKLSRRSQADPTERSQNTRCKSKREACAVVVVTQTYAEEVQVSRFTETQLGIEPLIQLFNDALLTEYHCPSAKRGELPKLRGNI